MIELFIIFCIVSLYVDIKIRKNVSFYSLFLLPTFTITITNELLFYQLGFYKIKDEVLIIMLISFSAIFLSSILTIPFIKKNKQIKNNISRRKMLRFSNLDIVITIIVALSFLNSFYLLASGYSYEQFKSALSSGFFAHLNSFDVLILPLLLNKQSNSRIQLIWKISIIIMAMTPIILYGTRGWLLMSLIAAIILKYHMLESKLPSPSKIILFSLSGYVLFLFTYLWKGESEFSITYLESLVSHSTGYLIAGVQGLNQLVDENIDKSSYINMAFNGVHNIIELFGEKNYASNASPNFFIINPITKQESNVSTGFGTVLYGIGYLPGFLLFFFLGLALHLFEIFLTNRENLYLKILLYLLMAAAFLSFFEFYFGNIFFIEAGIILTFLNFLEKNRFRNENFNTV